MIAKNKLHNRYLHGPGVVCGLQVVCGDCDGHVTVRSGYAIDPCGNDIVVCSEQDFDVAQAIADCCTASRSRNSDCDPYAAAWNSTCRDVEETWCITIRYLEKEARPTTALPTRTSRSPYRCVSAGCGCKGCGGGKGSASGKCSGSCGCGAAAATAATSAGTSAATSGGSGTQPASCQPTRIIESYRLGIVPEPSDGTYHDGGDSVLDKLKRFAPPGTLLRRLIDCALSAYTVLQKHMTLNELGLMLAVSEGKYLGTPAAQYAALCHFRQAIVALYAGDACNVRCDAAQQLAAIVCPTPIGNVTADQYGQSIRPVVQALAILGLQYLIDCWCCAFLPSCDSGVADDRLLLACVTVKDGKVLRICNLGPRQFAGSFPSVYYWLSIVPLIPLLRQALEEMCCNAFGSSSYKEVASPVAGVVAMDASHAIQPMALSGFRATALPDTNLWSLLSADNFAVPRDLFNRVEGLLKYLPANGSLAELASLHSVDMRPLVGSSPEAVASALTAGGVQMSVQQLDAAHADARRGIALASPLALRGDHVVVYQVGTRVIGFAAQTASTVPAADELAAMRSELAALRNEVAQLHKV